MLSFMVNLTAHLRLFQLAQPLWCLSATQRPSRSLTLDLDVAFPTSLLSTNLFPFNSFRTLFLDGAHATPFLSARCALSSVARRGGHPEELLTSFSASAIP